MKEAIANKKKWQRKERKRREERICLFRPILISPLVLLKILFPFPQLNHSNYPLLLCDVCKMNILCIPSANLSYQQLQMKTKSGGVQRWRQDGVNAATSWVAQISWLRLSGENVAYLDATPLDEDRWLNVLLTRLGISAKSVCLFLVKQAWMIRKADG